MIKNIQKISDITETNLRYRKRENMSGLYFKEMLAKIKGSKNKEDNHRNNRKENRHELERKNENKEDTVNASRKEHEGEGTFLDELC